MIVRFSGSLNAPRFPTKMDARVENVPRADCFAVVFDFSFWHIFFTFRFSCWWVEHSQYLFDECSDLCIGRQRERPQQSYGLRMNIILQNGCWAMSDVKKTWTKNFHKFHVIINIAPLKSVWKNVYPPKAVSSFENRHFPTHRPQLFIWKYLLGKI